MKKIWMALALLACLPALADEGMWLPHLLGQQKYAEMKAKGLKLTPAQIYDINKPSIKDAIVLFGTGCTGSIVSADGMLFTNQHCAQDIVSKLNTPEHNYVKDGFYATSRTEELPVPGLWVMFLIKVEDVSKQVEDSMKSYPNWDDWKANRAKVFAAISKAANSNENYTSYVYSMFNDNQFLLYTYERFNDVRLVGIPPVSIGNFGGETENWEYPRHAGDFAVFRIYTNNGNPSAYQASNVPYRSKYVLPISLKGFKENDFSMTIGYPGSTSRFETSYGIRLETDFTSPSFVRMRQIRLDAMMHEMEKDSVVNNKLASSYTSLANYTKYYSGETKQLKERNVYSQRKEQEDALLAWAAGKTQYADLFRRYERAYATWVPYARHKEYYDQGIMGIEIVNFANEFERFEKLIINNNNPKLQKQLLAELDSSRNVLLKEIDLAAQEEMLWRIVKAFHDDIATEQQPVLFYNLMKQSYGTLKEAETYQLWAKNVMSNSLILNDNKWKAFIKMPDGGSLQSDPLYFTAVAFRENWKKYRTQRTEFLNSLSQLNWLHVKAIKEMNGNKPMYPDANASMRISYGNIKGYKKYDSIPLKYITTAKSLLEKYKPGDAEFDMPVKEVQLLKAKDFGRYADPVLKDMVVSFISTDDQTGGSSGSPLLNANGEMIGISYDANSEALANKYVYDKNKTRVVNLDIRYALWCIDKLAGAANIIKELKILP